MADSIYEYHSVNIGREVKTNITFAIETNPLHEYYGDVYYVGNVTRYISPEKLDDLITVLEYLRVRRKELLGE